MKQRLALLVSPVALVLAGYWETDVDDDQHIHQR